MDVWRELENWKIASAHVQAHQIAGEVIKAKGNDDFIGSGGGGIHCNVSSDYKPNHFGGLERKDGKHIDPPANN